MRLSVKRPRAVFALLLFYFLFAFLFGAEGGAQEARAQELQEKTAALRIGVLPFRAAGTVEKSEALMISEIVQTHLSERRAFELVEIRHEEMLEETSFQLSGFVSGDEAVEIGQRLSLGYLLSGSCEGKEEKVRVTVQVTEVEAGRLLYGKTEEFEEEQIETELRKLVADLAVDLEGLTLGRSIDNIETLIRMERWDDAYAALKAYGELKGTTRDYREMRERILRGLEERTISRMDTLREAESPNELIELVPLLLAYGEDSAAEKNSLDKPVPFLRETYASYAKQIEVAAVEERKRILEEAEQRNFSYARELLHTARDTYPPSVELERLEQKVDELESGVLGRQARLLRKAGDYRQASFYAQQALELKPDSAEYITLLEEIEESKEERDEQARTVGAKKARWNPSRRENRYVDSTLAISFYSDSLKQLYIDGGFPLAELVFVDYAPIIPPLYRSLSAGASLTWGENTFSGNGVNIVNSFFHGEVLGAIGAALRYTRFEFGLEGRLSPGLLIRSLDFDDLDPGKSGREWDASLSLGVKAYARYAFNEQLLAGIGISSGPVYVPFEGRLGRFCFSLHGGWTF